MATTIRGFHRAYPSGWEGIDLPPNYKFSSSLDRAGIWLVLNYSAPVANPMSARLLVPIVLFGAERNDETMQEIVVARDLSNLASEQRFDNLKEAVLTVLAKHRMGI